MGVGCPGELDGIPEEYKLLVSGHTTPAGDRISGLIERNTTRHDRGPGYRPKAKSRHER